MSALPSLAMKIYRLLVACYPAEFRAEFGEEMRAVFAETLADAKRGGWSQMMVSITRELRDLPRSVWREHLRSRKGLDMNRNRSATQPLTTRELLPAIALFVIPALATTWVVLFGHHPGPMNIGGAILIGIMLFVLITGGLGFLKGIPRWAGPYMGVVLTATIFLGLVPRVWEAIYPLAYEMLGGRPATLPTRVMYQALMGGFSWFAVFAACALLVLLLAAWPRTRRLADSIRQDWTLFPFMLYGGIIFALELVFEEYTHDELWQIACWGSLAAGAWVYLKSTSTRKRILALSLGATITFAIAAVGKWIIIPLQSWGAFYGHDHLAYRRFELGSTIAHWAWLMFFMSIPALLTRIPGRRKSLPIAKGS